jgi:phosphate transport system protein
MSGKFHDEIDNLKEDVLKMGYLATDMLTTSIEALRERNKEKADYVYKKKEEIADMDEKLEEKAFQLIALYQPMAKDMRTIACCLKIITYLTRIGRYGKDIAKIASEILDKPHVSKLVSIPHMNDRVRSMVNDALKAFKTEDLTLISDFSNRDNDIDSLRYSIFRECITYMMEDPKKIERCARYVMVARYLERCADHACKMAEKIHYMVTGERIEIR